ncbi:DnaD and phage-associated domain-containing protein [Streptococcus urinalis FB127-CNA-2]|uniref:Replication initiation and membrane attachment protein, DnaB/DnaD family n=1 Tax=Streptococcus urinalis 2285-97 TaxID=764291 RepID=G5KH22_9STRE|nr:DnaD domain-containing protein [Streptococcus urinalis]EHJ55863.1 replication initiation and membrane attachment protein, DnaB/DnaD family [Streptococcus urinalis 2285-97]EKS22462.1 DnaD and phage-associated domain-containing protein [Streptococcus urinalis FB127-CNA-2]VEF32275.1 DNA replication protein [Streptococcus urinalis]
MTYLQHYKNGNLVIPEALLFHYKDIFQNADEFLVWQFIYMQNTIHLDELVPSQIASAIGKTVAEVNQIISDLTRQNLLDMKTIELSGEIQILFDASPVLSKLDQLIAKETQNTSIKPKVNISDLKSLAEDFERELGRLLSPFELEDLQKLVLEDNTDPDLIREALKEAVFNGKTNWKYIQAILRNWRKEGIINLRQVEERRQSREENQQSQVSVSDDFLSAMNLWSD